MNAFTRNSGRTVFLDAALQPLRRWLDDPLVVEICANGPGSIWVEILGESAMRKFDVSELTESALRHPRNASPENPARASTRNIRCSRRLSRRANAFRA